MKTNSYFVKKILRFWLYLVEQLNRRTFNVLLLNVEGRNLHKNFEGPKFLNNVAHHGWVTKKFLSI